jgi:hypothetical protein
MRHALDVHCMHAFQTHIHLWPTLLSRRLRFSQTSRRGSSFLDAADHAARLSITVPVLPYSARGILQRGKRSIGTFVDPVNAAGHG